MEDQDLRAAGLDAARKRVAAAPGAGVAADARTWRSSGPTQRPGDRRGPLPPPPPPRRGGGGGKRDAGKEGDGAGDARKTDEVGGGGGGAAKSGAVARVGPVAEGEPSAAGGNAGSAVVRRGGNGGAARVVAPREGVSGGGGAGSKKMALVSSAAPREGSGSGEVGRKKWAFASVEAPRAYPPPKRRMVSAEGSFPPGCGRGGGEGSRLVAAGARPGGDSAASPKKPAAAAARRPAPSVDKTGSGGVLVLKKKASAAVGGSSGVAAPAHRGGSPLTKPTSVAAGARRPPSVSKVGSGSVLEKASAAVGSSRPVISPARRSGDRAALPTKPAAAPHGAVGKAGSVGVLKKVPAAVVPRPVADGGGHHVPRAPALKSLGPSRQSGVSAAAADGLLDTDSQGRSGRGGFGSGKEVVQSPPKTAVTPGRGRVKVSQPLNRSAEKCLDTESKDSSTSSDSFGPKKKVSVKSPDYRRLKIASACVMGSISTVGDLVDSIVADDAFWNAEAAYRKELQQKLNGSLDARSKFKMICDRFHFICNAIVQFVQQHSLRISRIDIAGGKVIKKLPGFTQQGPVIGTVPGVEVGDEFLYRVQLALVGLHRSHRTGIDYIKDDIHGLLAISIVASGRYPGELSSSGELIYTGSGGKYAGKKSDENQKLKGPNLALKNCIDAKTPVRVIHGIKSREESSHSKAKGASAFIYDGLYHVVDYWKAGQAGSKVFKYRLLRIPDQPELPNRSKIASSRKTGKMPWR
ncbi:unnamed protein product [Urochloa humidicola]